VAIFLAPPRISRNYVYWLIPINLAADLLVTFSSDDVFHAGMIRAGLVYPYLILSLFKLRPLRHHYWLFIMLAYFLIMVFQSSNVNYSFWQLLKVSSGLLVYPIAFVYIRTQQDFQKLGWSVVAAGYIILLNFVLAQIFKIGESPYVGSVIYLGAGMVQTTYVLAYLTLISPVLMDGVQGAKRKRILFAVASGLIVVVLTFKRATILAVAIGSFVLGMGTKYRKRVIQLTVVGLVVVTAIYYQFKETIDLLLEARLNFEQEMTSKGGRVHEFTYVVEPFVKGDLKRMIFGHELFNSVNLDQAIMADGTRRPLHVDYNVILHGSGLLGLFLYLYFHFRMWVFNRKLAKRFKRVNRFKDYDGAFLAVLLGHLVISSSYQLPVITSLTTVFLIFGALNSVRYQEAIRSKT